MDNFDNEPIISFLNNVQSTEPIPSGGAVIGLTGALSASLAEMVANLSILNKKYENFKGINQELSRLFNYASTTYLKLMQLDSYAYLMLRQVYQEKFNSDEEKEKMITEAVQRSCEPPSEVILLGEKISKALVNLSLTGTKMALSDIGVCATLIESTIKSSWLTILINYNSLNKKDTSFIEKIKEIKLVKDNTIKILKQLFDSIEKDLTKNDI